MRLATAASMALLMGACSTVNYTDPAGPVYVGGQERADTDPALRLVTFNVEYALRVDEAIAALRRPPLAGADVVALQEMDRPGVERIAAALGVGFVYVPVSVHPRTHRDFGNAILSPWPLRAPRKVLLPHRSLIYNQARAAATAVVVVNGQEIRVYSLHLGAPRGTSERKRLDQADGVIADAARERGPVVILGDVNSSSLGDRFAAAGYRWLTRDVGPTSGPWSIDHVFVRGLKAPERASAGVARDGARASDHWPVWVVMP